MFVDVPKSSFGERDGYGATCTRPHTAGASSGTRSACGRELYTEWLVAFHFTRRFLFLVNDYKRKSHPTQCHMWNCVVLGRWKSDHMHQFVIRLILLYKQEQHQSICNAPHRIASDHMHWFVIRLIFFVPTRTASDHMNRIGPEAPMHNSVVAICAPQAKILEHWKIFGQDIFVSTFHTPSYSLWAKSDEKCLQNVLDEYFSTFQNLRLGSINFANIITKDGNCMLPKRRFSMVERNARWVFSNHFSFQWIIAQSEFSHLEKCFEKAHRTFRPAIEILRLESINCVGFLGCYYPS